MGRLCTQALVVRWIRRPFDEAPRPDQRRSPLHSSNPGRHYRHRDHRGHRGRSDITAGTLNAKGSGVVERWGLAALGGGPGHYLCTSWCPEESAQDLPLQEGLLQGLRRQGYGDAGMSPVTTPAPRGAGVRRSSLDARSCTTPAPRGAGVRQCSHEARLPSSRCRRYQHPCIRQRIRHRWSVCTRSHRLCPRTWRGR